MNKDLNIIFKNLLFHHIHALLESNQLDTVFLHYQHYSVLCISSLYNLKNIFTFLTAVKEFPC